MLISQTIVNGSKCDHHVIHLEAMEFGSDMSQRWTLLILVLLLSILMQAESLIREKFLHLGAGFKRQLATAPPAPTPIAPVSCEPVTVNFDSAANGTALTSPLCMENEWVELGLILFAKGGVGKHPCLFDMANLGSKETGGDPDLGAPNQACPGKGPAAKVVLPGRLV